MPERGISNPAERIAQRIRPRDSITSILGMPSIWMPGTPPASETSTGDVNRLDATDAGRVNGKRLERHHDTCQSNALY